MKLSRSVVIAALFACLLDIAWAANPPAGQAPAARAPVSQAKVAESPVPPAILPPQFEGWQMQGSAATSTDPAAADPTIPAILKEYGFSDLASANYTRDDGRTLKIRAMRFADASGAYGAYTFYLQPEAKTEQIGDQGSSLGQRVSFYRGHVLVDALFSERSAASAGELRYLAGALPRPPGNAGNLPAFIEFMPQRARIENTTKYALGPATLSALAAPVSAEVVDFGASSEAALRRYNTDSGEATLMLISYPTPQLAESHLHRLEATYQQAQTPAQPQPGVSTIACAGELCYKRSGPIIAIAIGPASANDAKSLLGMVSWDAKVTWNTPSENAQVKDLYMLILNIVILCGILTGLAIVAGVAFGGIRILMKRYFPDKVFDRPEQMEFISLRLTETVIEGSSQTGADGGRSSPQNPS